MEWTILTPDTKYRRIGNNVEIVFSMRIESKKSYSAFDFREDIIPSYLLNIERCSQVIIWQGKSHRLNAIYYCKIIKEL